MPLTRFFVVDDDEWLDVPDEDVLQHAPLYDSPEPSAHLIEDLANYPLRDEAGHINQVFTKDGNRVPRRTPMHNAEYHRCGVLFDLKAVRRTFSGQEPLPAGIHGDPNTREDHEPVEHYLYPHCYTTSVGQWQAKGVYPTLHHAVRQVNEGICADFEAAPVEPTRRRAVWPLSSQGYNLLAHRYRHQGAQHHDVQKGRITAFAAGTHAVSVPAVRAFQKVRSSLLNSLPHQDFAEKISTRIPSNLPPFDAEAPEAELQMDVRQEVMYVIHFDRIPEHNRDGS